MAYADQEMSGSKVTSIIIVAVIHVVIGYLLISGLAVSAVKEIAKTVTTIDIEEEEPPPPEEPEPEPQPEQPQETAPPPPVAPPPPISIAPAPPPIRTTPNIPPPSPPALTIPPPAPVAPPAPPAPPPAPPSQARGASPSGQSRWARRIQENYPRRAIREEVEGSVGVRVGINADGRVSSCNVVRSSGSSALDEAACSGMRRYARFDPALNDAGNPTTGSYSTTISYRLD